MSNQERVAERRKHWGELIARQQQSGKTVKAFCEEDGVGRRRLMHGGSGSPVTQRKTGAAAGF